MQIRPAAVTADPASGTIPTGYLVWNVTDGAVKRHAGAYSWEITVGAGTTAKVGFHGATPTAQRAGAAQAAVTYDLRFPDHQRPADAGAGPSDQGRSGRGGHAAERAPRRTDLEGRDRRWRVAYVVSSEPALAGGFVANHRFLHRFSAIL